MRNKLRVLLNNANMIFDSPLSILLASEQLQDIHFLTKSDC